MTAGRKKALIILGHIPSEQDGMEAFARPGAEPRSERHEASANAE